MYLPSLGVFTLASFRQTFTLGLAGCERARFRIPERDWVIGFDGDAGLPVLISFFFFHGVSDLERYTLCYDALGLCRFEMGRCM